jgi:hypothetical protein
MGDILWMASQNPSLCWINGGGQGHVRCNRVEACSGKYILGITANICNKRRNTNTIIQKFVILGFFYILSSFLTTKTS